MDQKTYWEQVYQTKAPDAVSWYRQHLEKSLELIKQADTDPSACIIDVGGGESTLVDDLLEFGYRNISVLDISETAIDVSKHRLGNRAALVSWIAANITDVELPSQRYDVWHDRAVFHFLTTSDERSAYVKQVANSVKPGGHVIVATFGPQGPEKCSGLTTMRYDANSLHKEFGPKFKLIESATELHATPFGTMQQFLYCYCVVEAT
ncbi:MAG TPA: class I SAM-dependent methyltransferase [Candidatus Obscuribacter sp.]|nr:class I SAM-dependent methyltransferase [Candidatus Obscuribacter sp.]HND66359.1 class I SAM-dependent methyltransferase [Candidatus Obscuribacter sp.]HNH72836.1 class I SAM-dependent methyltransferase [Candidatus Obscuribacter sp.]